MSTAINTKKRLMYYRSKSTLSAKSIKEPLLSGSSYSTILRDAMGTKELLAYSVSHFGNDLCASMWFVYLNYYLLYIVKLSPAMTAWTMLSG